MGKKDTQTLTAIQHLVMAHLKLTAIKARLEQFGEAANEDPKALGRVEHAMELIGGARFALSAEDDPPDGVQEELPF